MARLRMFLSLGFTQRRLRHCSLVDAIARDVDGAGVRLVEVIAVIGTRREAIGIQIGIRIIDRE